jgi:hypothetical protein
LFHPASRSITAGQPDLPSKSSEGLSPYPRTSLS